MSSAPLRNRGNVKLHVRTSETDRWLEEMGFYRKRIARDSSCLFRAVSENIYNSQHHFRKVRQDCVAYMAENRAIFEGVGYSFLYCYVFYFDFLNVKCCFMFVVYTLLF